MTKTIARRAAHVAARSFLALALILPAPATAATAARMAVPVKAARPARAAAPLVRAYSGGALALSSSARASAAALRRGAALPARFAAPFAPLPARASAAGSAAAAPGSGVSLPQAGAARAAGPRNLSSFLAGQARRWKSAGAEFSRRAFDGGAAAAALSASSRGGDGAPSARGMLARRAAENEVIQDLSIPTPEAARRVGRMRREGASRWALPAAGAALVAAAAAAHFVGFVPVAVLGAGLLVSVLAHEASHLAVLRLLGDRTAAHAGEHSLNPFHHIDPVTTVLLPAVTLMLTAPLGIPLVLGAAKPVHADFNSLRGVFSGKRSARNAFWVAASGPLTNAALAGLAYAAFLAMPAGAPAAVAWGLFQMNAALALFNLLPLPQLDGGKMLASVLPEAWYARWVYNPRLEKGYQGLFRRLYEGPAYVLTFIADRLGIRGYRDINRLANGLTFAALAAFYAAAYFGLSVTLPLLFLALPCTYDYWCIREKVRSEAAVEDVMKLYSEWAGVIAQIAEDSGFESEVDLFEAEHAMKNALENLVDELMAKEEFRLLPDAEKLERFMERYPEEAAKLLKEKVFAAEADTIEKVRALLKDARNGPFYERLRRWFGEHDVFARWDNPAYEGKLRDAVGRAGEGKAREQGGRGGPGGGTVRSLALAGLPILTAAFHAFGGSVVLGASRGGGIGSVAFTGDEPEPGLWRDKVDYSAREGLLLVAEPISGLNLEQVRAVAQAIARTPPVRRAWFAPALGAIVVVPREGERDQAIEAAARLAGVSLVLAAEVNRELPTRISGIPYPGHVSRDFISTLVADYGVEIQIGPGVLSIASNDREALAAAIFELTYRNAPASPAAPARDSRFWRAKLVGDETIASEHIRIRLSEGLSPEQRRETVAAISQSAGAGTIVHESETSLLLIEAGERRVAAVFRAARLEAVEAVRMSPRFLDHINQTLVQTDVMAAQAALDEGESAPARSAQAEPGAADPSPEAAEPPAPAVPEKVSSHGKEHYSTAAVLVRFVEGAAEAEAEAILRGQGETRLYRFGAFYVFRGESLEAAERAAREFAKSSRVAAVEVHPNLAARMEGRTEVPYPAAKIYDPSQSILVEFKQGTEEAAVREYAEARRLSLVHLGYRGRQGLALMEILRGAGVDDTLRILADETVEEGSPVAQVGPLQTQEGQPAFVEPSPEARRAGEERRAREQAAEAAAREVPRRDAHADWLAYLETRKLDDGTTLTPKQVQGLAGFLKPVAKRPGQTRAPVVSRTAEVKRILPIVTAPRGMRNSVILVGEAGTGKTAVAEGLAEMIEEAEHATARDPEAFLQFQRLKGRWLVELDVDAVLTQQDPVGTLMAILNLLPRLNDSDPSRGNEVILLVDEIQKFFLDANGQKIANALKGPLRDGRMSVIATTTTKEYKNFIESDDAFRRRLEKIDIAEPTVPQTISILKAMKRWLEGLHKAKISDEALTSAAKLSDQFDKGNHNPDKAIKAVQDAAELSRPENIRAALTLDIREALNELVVAVNEARQALLDKAIPSTLALPVELYNRVAQLVSRVSGLYAEVGAVADGEGQVTEGVVKRVIAQKTGVASGQLTAGEQDAARYAGMEALVSKRVVNQERAIAAIASAIRRNKAGLSDPNQPMGKFLLVGPTGVGKTFLAKELARFLFGDPEAMTRFDMSEFMEKHSAARLIGSPPGYVGYGEGGQLTEAVRRKPYSVILFDEVEKAHPDVFNVLLQVLDDGRLTDGEGRTVDFKNTVILMTSNAGMAGVDGEKYAQLLAKLEAHNASVQEKAARRAEIEAAWDAEIDEAVAQALKAGFRPEFLNRLDEDPSSKNKWIRVNRLRDQDMPLIARLQLTEFAKMLDDRHNAELIFDDSLVAHLAKEGFHPLYGARPMKAAVAKLVVDPLARWILGEEPGDSGAAKKGKAGRRKKRREVKGSRITVAHDGERVVFRIARRRAKKTARTVVAGAAERAAAEIFTLIEELAGGGGDEPTAEFFDQAMRRARAELEAAPPAQAPKAAPGPERKGVLAAGGTLAMPASAKAVAAAHNQAKVKDASLRAAFEEIAQAARRAGWPEEAVAALAPAPGAPGEGWLKLLTSFAKERAAAAQAAPIELVSAVEPQRLRVLIHLDAELSEADKAYLAAHFTGTPPASYEAAQRMVDNLNVRGGPVRNHNLLDLYRRLWAVPGTRMGYSTGAAARGGKGSDLWLEIRRDRAPEGGAKLAAAPAERAEAPASPHQAREADKTRRLLMGFVDQSHLPESARDGHAIRIAAAEAYALLSGPAEAQAARGWLKDKGWDLPPGEGKAKVGGDWPLAMAAALILERHGSAEDIPRLEALSVRVAGRSHYEVPVHTALVSALSRLYALAGLREIRGAISRAAQLRAVNSDDIEAGARRALGHKGVPADWGEVRGDAEGILALAARAGRGPELSALFYDDERWRTVYTNDEAMAVAALLYAQAAEPGEKALPLMSKRVRAFSSYSAVGLVAARTWAVLAARERRVAGLGAAIQSFLDAFPLDSGKNWGVLLAYVETLRLAGGRENLAPLERLLQFPPSRTHVYNEQAYFTAPEAWARTVLRSGLYAEYARPRMEGGAPKPSILQEMLASKDHPMRVAAAIRLIAYARQAAPKGPAKDPGTELPLPDFASDAPLPAAPAGSAAAGGSALGEWNWERFRRRSEPY